MRSRVEEVKKVVNRYPGVELLILHIQDAFDPSWWSKVGAKPSASLASVNLIDDRMFPLLLVRLCAKVIKRFAIHIHTHPKLIDRTNGSTSTLSCIPSYSKRLPCHHQNVDSSIIATYCHNHRVITPSLRNQSYQPGGLSDNGCFSRGRLPRQRGSTGRMVPRH